MQSVSTVGGNRRKPSLSLHAISPPPLTCVLLHLLLLSLLLLPVAAVIPTTLQGATNRYKSPKIVTFILTCIQCQRSGAERVGGFGGALPPQRRRKGGALAPPAASSIYIYILSATLSQKLQEPAGDYHRVRVRLPRSSDNIQDASRAF